MADPLSVAASAAGLLSLGIQVTQGISTYLDALKCRQEDLDVVSRKNDALRHIIGSVNSIVPSQQPLNRPHAAVRDCIAICKDELEGLETLVAQLSGCKNTQTWKTRLQNQSRKLSYPFTRSRVQELSQQLDQANGTLQVALEGLGIHIAQRSEQTIERVAASIHGFSAEFHSVRSEVASIRQSSEESKSLQRDHYDRVENHLAMYTTSLSAIVSTTQNHNTALIAQNAELIAEIGNLRKLVAAKEQGSTSKAQVTPAQAVLRVARSPPSQLKRLCDDLGGRDSIEYLSSETDNLVCLCNGSGRKAKRGCTHWGVLFLYHERSRSAHQSHCPWAKKTEKLGLGFFVLTKILQVAIDVSFTLSSGAGGWSLSQSCTYHPTVDSETDPVFQALETFAKNHEYYFQAEEGFIKESKEVMELLQEVQQIYTEGRSSPNAVDSENSTPLHRIFLKYSYRAYRLRSWETIYKGLRSLGVPTTSCNLAGRTWLSGLPDFASSLQSDYQSTLALSTIVQSDFVGIPLNPQAADFHHICYLIELFDMSPIVAETYGCGPMCLAVLANNSEQVEHLLASRPNSVLEKTSAGQTPLHLAANKPSCLRLLVRASTHSLVNQRDGEGMTVLDYALHMSGRRCTNSPVHRHKCTRCHCTECVAILLNADCEVSFDHRSHGGCFEYASERARRRFVSHIANRRQRLNQLAQSNSSIIIKGGLSVRANELPDAHAPLIIDLLRANKVVIPPALDMSTPRDVFKSIFQVVSKSSSANLFFRRGFRDIDSLVNGQTPLTVHRNLSAYNAGYIQWLVDNGADVFRLLIPSCGIPDSAEIRGIFAAHSVLHQTGEWLASSTPSRFNDESWVDETSTLISRVLPSSVRDGCNCACSDDGCTPLVYLLKAIRATDKTLRLQAHPQALDDNAEFILQNFDQLDKALDVQIQLSSIRWITFEALELTHTCCNPEEVFRSRDGHTVSETDDLSLAGEDPEVLEMFERLVVELWETAQSVHAATCSLVPFWTDAWTSRVKKATEELRSHNLSEKEREDSEAIGVTWHHPPQQPERSAGRVTGNPYRWGTWESVEWKDRQRDPSRYKFLGEGRPRASVLPSG